MQVRPKWEMKYDHEFIHFAARTTACQKLESKKVQSARSSKTQNTPATVEATK
jgi:hypothetical protein